MSEVRSWTLDVRLYDFMTFDFTTFDFMEFDYFGLFDTEPLPLLEQR